MKPCKRKTHTRKPSVKRAEAKLPRRRKRRLVGTAGRVEGRKKYVRNSGKKCSVAGCVRDADCRELCFAHWRRKRNGSKLTGPINEPLIGPINPNWKSGIHKTLDGRVRVHFPSHPSASKTFPYILRSRLVMEKHLGRILKSGEIVHHINGIVDDDRIENLELTTRSLHMKLHAKLRREAQWSLHFKKCVQCSTTAIPHKGRGLCDLCFGKRRRLLSKAKANATSRHQPK